MRTTIEIPDALFHRAKLAAVQSRRSLKSLITHALQKELDSTADTSLRMNRPPIRGTGAASIPALTNAEAAALLDDEDLDKLGQ